MRPHKGKKPEIEELTAFFSIDMWSMFHVVKKHTSTTNNSLEAFNGNFNQCQPGHQTIYSALEGFKREVEFTEIKHSELTSGKFSEPQTKRKNLKLSSFTILFWEALYILKSRQCLPFYFGEHCKFMRSCLHLRFYHVQIQSKRRKKLLFFL